jgi:hypothetical protein
MQHADVGYFNRRRSRMRDLQAFASAFPADAALDAAAWASAGEVTEDTRARVAEAYVRFAVRARGLAEHAYRGIFHTAYSLARGRVGSDDKARLDELLVWFEANLPPHDPRSRRAVFWFRSGAAECIDRAWELVFIVQRAGFKVLVLHTDAPGRVVYRDDHQVAALPHKT